jgi:hypothetical protein
LEVGVYEWVIVAVSVGVMGSMTALGVGLGTMGVDGMTGVAVPLPVQAVKTRVAMINQPDKGLIRIFTLILQLHLPDGF